MLPSEILKHECNMIIGLFPLPVVCGWCVYSVITAVGLFLLDPGCPGGPLSAADSGGGWPLPILFGLVLGDPGRPCVLGPLESPCVLGSPVEGLASLQWV